MLHFEDEKFIEWLKQLEAMDNATRKAFFTWSMSANKFLLWWIYFFREDFITNLADFHYEWIEALLSDKNVMIEWFRWSIKTTLVVAVTTYKIANNFTKFVVWQSYEDTASTANTTNIARNLLSPRLSDTYWKLFKLSWGSKEDLEKKSVSNFDTSNWVKVRAASLWEAKIYFLWNTINNDWIVPRFRKEKKGTKGWLVYHQPLIIEGEIQWDFFTEKTLDKIREDEWPVAFNQNYLLVPVDSYSEWFIKREHLRYWHSYNIDDFDDLYIHADTTHTWKATSDYFCSMVIWESKRDNNYYILDFILEKMDVETQSNAVINQYMKFHNRVRKLTYDEKANQGFWFWIKKLAKEEYNISLPIQELKYPKDKVTHFEPHIPHFIANRVYLPANHAMLTEAETELLAFPTKGINDDFVDWLSWVLDNFAIIKQEAHKIKRPKMSSYM